MLSAIWELPFKGNRFVEGWQIGVITQGQTRQPDHHRDQHQHLHGQREPAARPAGPIEVFGQPEQWFSNTVCDPRVRRLLHVELGLRAARLARAAQFHMGNLARNAVIGPGFFNTDLSIIKKTRMGRATVEFRAEAFNVFNHPNFGVGRWPAGRPRWAARASGCSARRACPPATPARRARSSSR